MFVRAAFPLLSVLLPALYIHGLHALHVLDVVTSRVFVAELFLPVLLWEWRVSRWFAGGRSDTVGTVARCLFWGALFYGWVIELARWSNIVLPNGEEWKWLKWVGPKVYVNVGLVLGGMLPFTVVAAIVWAASYGWLTVRHRRARLTTGLFVPIALMGAIFAELYLFGGIGGLWPVSSLVAQPGVRQVFSVVSLADETVVRNHPRDICVDEDAGYAIASFGCTFCPSSVKYPSLIRVELATGAATATFLTGPIREFDCPAGKDMFVAPWQDDKIFLLDKSDFSFTRRHTPYYRHSMEIWEPMATVYDEVNQRLFIVNDVEPAVVAIAADGGEWLGSHNLYEMGLVGYGLAAQALVQPVPGGKLYFTAGDGENLFEMDPLTLELRHIPLGDAVGTAIAVDVAGDRIWYQASLYDAISEVRISDFAVLRTLDGERFSRGLHHDGPRNTLYLLGYFSGTLSAIDLTSGQERWAVRVGGRPNSMHVKDDVAWVNSTAGVIRVDLAEVWSDQ